MLPHLTIILLQPNHESFQSCGMNVLSIMFECILRLYKCFHRTRKLQDRICILNLPKTLPQQYGNSKQHQSKEGWRWNSNAARPNTTIYQGDDHNQFPLIQGNNFYLSCTQNTKMGRNVYYIWAFNNFKNSVSPMMVVAVPQDIPPRLITLLQSNQVTRREPGLYPDCLANPNYILHTK